MKFKMGTFNIAGGSQNESSLECLAEIIQKAQLDLIGFQEVDQFTGRQNCQLDMLAAITAKLPQGETHFSPAMPLEKGAYGIGFWSRWPILEAETGKLMSKNFEPRVFQRLRIEAAGQQIVVYNTHLSFEEAVLRQRQLSFLKEKMQAEADNAVVLLGDFNSDQSLDEQAIFAPEFQLSNGHQNHWLETFNQQDAQMKNKAIDQIIVSKKIKIDTVQKIDNTVSDHNLLWGQYQL